MDLDQRPTIRACPGETVELSVPGEGIGGFTWHAEIPGQPATLIGEAMGSPPAGTGAGPEKLFRVRMETTGETVVRLIQKRPWESTPHRVIEYPIRCEIEPSQAG